MLRFGSRHQRPKISVYRFPIVYRFAAAVIKRAVPGFGVKKWSKIPGLRCAKRHGIGTKQLIDKALLATDGVRDAIFSRLFPA